VPCLRCGSDIPVDAIEVVYDRDVARTVALMRGQFDNVRCISGCPTDIPSSAVFYAKEEGLVRGIAVYTANLHDRFETAVAPELRRLAPRNGMGVRVDTMDELRQDVAELLTARIRPCLDLLTARSAPDFGKRWRELTVARFTALKVALEGALPRVQLAPRAEKALAWYQYAVWTALCAEWETGGRQLPRFFEEDLARYVDDTPVIGDALEQLSADISREDAAGKADDVYLYCARAIEATLYRQAGIEIPDDLLTGSASEGSGYESAGLKYPDDWRWAGSYLDLELKRHRTWRRRSVLDRIRVSEDRARATVSATGLGVWIETRLMITNTSSSPGTIKPRDALRVQAAARRAGHVNLFDRIFASQILVKPDTDALSVVLELIADVPRHAVVSVMANERQWWPVAHRGKLEDLQELSRALTERTGPWQAMIIMGEVYRTARYPSAWLAHLSSLGSPVSSRDNWLLRSELSDQRALALCLAGRAADAAHEVAAWQVAEHGNSIDAFDLPLHKHELVEAAVLREAGHWDRALEILELLWARLRPSQLPAVAVELAPTCFLLGRYDQAIATLRTAHEHAWAFASKFAPLIKAQLLYALARQTGDAPVDTLAVASNSFHYDEKTGVTSEPFETDRIVDLYLVLAHLERVRRDPDAAGREDELELFGRLPELARTAAERGDCFLHLQALRALALHEELRTGQVSDRWPELAAVAEETYQVDPPAECFLRPALWVAAAGQFDTALQHVAKADRLVSRTVAKLSDFDNVATVEVVRTQDLREVQRRWLDGEHAPGSFALVRTAGELWRDPARRMTDGEGTFADDQTIEEFGTRTGMVRIGVLEQVEDRLLLTVIQAGNPPQTTVLTALEESLPALAVRLITRISNWTPSRPGDPLDLPAWRRFAEGLRELLSSRLDPSDHVVLIEPPGLTRLPWHLAIAPHWSFSYAPSWGSLLQRPEAAEWRPSIGAVCAPRFGEGITVENALTTSVARNRDEAGQAGLPFTAAVGTGADTRATVAILEACDICTLLCHGLVDPAGSSVALLLSASGRRPLGTSDAAATEQGRAHRFGWREATQVSRAPRVIFSAACSSGLNHAYGGQQVGLFSALRRHGLRTLIAPRWDILAEQALPILDRCRSSVIAGQPPAAALRSACINAQEAGVSPWIAWGLALEGDW
jgi:tetratricopeptide (TPR) repeat protein